MIAADQNGDVGEGKTLTNMDFGKRMQVAILNTYFVKKE